MLQESVEGLAIQPDGIYVDVTFGGGGHSKEILSQLGAKGRLYAFDQDQDAANNMIEDERFKLLPFNFRYLKRCLRLEGVKKVDGILADLGVSSHQFDEAERGFAFRLDAQLDMRMNQEDNFDAQQLIQTYSAEELQRVFGEFGEIRNAKTLAEHIVAERATANIETVAQFVAIIGSCVRGKRNKYLAQVFQALRIEVNAEIEVLKEMLLQAVELLKTDGRLSVISYHSLEDRLVKNLIRNGVFEKEPEKDLYGNFYQPLKAINRKVIMPTDEETKENPRARSARLRIAKKIVD